MDNQDDWIKLRLGSTRQAITADAFLGAFRHAIDALKAIDKGMSAHGTETIQWQIVDTGLNSPIFATLRSVPTGSSGAGYGLQVINSFVSGVGQLSRANVCPPWFTKDALQHLKALVAIAFLHQLEPTFSTATQEVSVQQAVAENAAWAIRRLESKKNRYTEYGSLEGTLKQLSVSHHKDKLVLVDRLTGDEIYCVPNKPEELDAVIRQAWKKRVSVTGRIVVDRLKQRPIRVAVDSIRILRDQMELPQIESLHGIDITGGVDSAQYIRDLRDDE